MYGNYKKACTFCIDDLGGPTFRLLNAECGDSGSDCR